MTWKPYLIFFLLLLIPFGAFFLRPDLVGYDTYGHLLLVCKNNNIIGLSGIQYLLFSLLPCNIIAIKALLFCLCFVSGCIIIRMATLFSPEHGWKACFLLFLSSTTVLEFVKLENDQFAYPILFGALLLYYYGIKKSSRKHFYSAWALLVPTIFLWGGAVFFAIAFALNYWIILLLMLPAFLYCVPKPWGSFCWYGLLGQIIRTKGVLEDLPFKFHVHFLMNFGLAGALLEPLLMPQALLFFIMGVASAKFWILSLPFLTVGLVLLLEKLEMPSLTPFFAIISIAMLVGATQSVLTQPPTQDDWQAIQTAIESGEEINNDWGMGYWVLWAGGETKSYGTLHRQQRFEENQLVVTKKELPECTLLQSRGQNRVYRC